MRNTMIIRAVYKWLIKLIEAISIIGISLIVLFTIYEVISRELINRPTIWTNEITSYLLVWFGMLGIVYAFDKETHVSVDFVFKRLSIKVQQVCSVITCGLMFAFSLLVSIYGYKYWFIAFKNGWRHYGMLDIPMSYTRISLPIVGLFLVFQTSLATYDAIIRLRQQRTTGEDAEGV